VALFILSCVNFPTPLKGHIQSIKCFFFIHYLDLANFLSLCTKLFFKKLIDSEFMTVIHSNEKSILRNKMKRKIYNLKSWTEF